MIILAFFLRFNFYDKLSQGRHEQLHGDASDQLQEKSRGESQEETRQSQTPEGQTE